MSKKRRWPRYIMIGLIVVSVVYLGIRVFALFNEASTTFNAAAQLNQSSLASMVVHKRPFTPPKDNVLRSEHLAFLERVTWALDTIKQDGSDVAWRRRNILATLFNEHSVGLEEYRWMRSAFLSAIQAEKKSSARSKADSINLVRMRMIGPIIKEHITPLLRKDDIEAL